MTFDQLDFAVYCIGLVASKLNMNQTDVYDRLKKSGILGGYIVKGYGALHTFSSDYIADDLIDVKLWISAKAFMSLCFMSRLFVMLSASNLEGERHILTFTN